MKEFDFKLAWEKAADPAANCLPDDVKVLFADTLEWTKDLVQKKDYNMPWPKLEYSEFEERFDKCPAEVLAKAARVIFCWGHWGPSGCSAHGGYWKFANYADQSLSKRLKIGPSKKEIGSWVEVSCGMLKVCSSTKDEWYWQEVALATKTNLQKVLKMCNDFKSIVSDDDMAAIRSKLIPKEGFIFELIDISGWMKEKNEDQYC